MTPNMEGILARRDLPIDTRRSESIADRPSDTFRPSLRTPLDADRILAARAEATAPILGSGESSAAGDEVAADGESQEARSGNGGDAKKAEGGKDGKKAEGDLSEEEKAQVAELKRRDTEVRAHEQAHLAASGGMARGGASYDYQSGPDGKRYAVGGEVQIAMKSGKTPEETIRNAEQVRSAALAPANPSSVDQQTAAAAARMAQEARQELSAKSMESGSKDGESEGREEGGARRIEEGKSGDAADAAPTASVAPRSYSLASEHEEDDSAN